MFDLRTPRPWVIAPGKDPYHIKASVMLPISGTSGMYHEAQISQLQFMSIWHNYNLGGHMTEHFHRKLFGWTEPKSRAKPDPTRAISLDDLEV